MSVFPALTVMLLKFEVCWLSVDVPDPAIVPRYCAPQEIEDIHRHGRDWFARFLVYWTLKEAYLKARGLGISVVLSDIAFDLTADQVKALDQGKGVKVATAQKLNRFAAKFFRDQMKDQKHIAEYFRKRGVTGDLATNFYVSAAPASWDALSRFFVAAKAPMKLAEELGLDERRRESGGVARDQAALS